MKKIVGIFGLSCFVLSGLMVVGCSGKSDEGTPPKAATDVPPVAPGQKPPKNG